MCDYDNWPDVDDWMQANFPRLPPERREITSDPTCLYNCIAWAANDTENWWWPSEDSYWPEGIPLNDLIDTFKLAFQRARNYEPCADGNLEQGYEKVAIYGVAGRAKHMARQLASGVWTSKLGMGWDITHQVLPDVECAQYGQVAEYMRRPTIPSEA